MLRIAQRGKPRFVRIVLSMLLAAMVPCLQGCPTLSGCVVQGTLVECPKGAKPIESIQVGDEVVAHDEAGASVGRVSAVLRSTADRFLRIRFEDGRELDVTDQHPIATAGGWMKAGQLRPGDQATTEDTGVVITSIQQRSGPIAVYDLTVEPQQNYYASGVLVHNKSIIYAPALSQLTGTWIGGLVGDLRHGRASLNYRMEIDPEGWIVLVRFGRSFEMGKYSELRAEWALASATPLQRARERAWSEELPMRTISERANPSAVPDSLLKLRMSYEPDVIRASLYREVDDLVFTRAESFRTALEKTQGLADSATQLARRLRDATPSDQATRPADDPNHPTGTAPPGAPPR